MSRTRSHTANSPSVGSQQSAVSQQSAGSHQSTDIFGINPENVQQNVDRADRFDSCLHTIPPCSIVGGVQANSLVIDLRSVFEDSNVAYNEDVEMEIFAELDPELVQHTEQADEDAMVLSDWARIAAGDA